MCCLESVRRQTVVQDRLFHKLILWQLPVKEKHKETF